MPTALSPPATLRSVRTTLWVIAAIVGGLLTSPAGAGSSQAGSAIDNTATMSFVSGPARVAGAASSNAVRAIVATVEGASLLPAGATTHTPAGPFTVAVTLTNDGNVATTFFAQIAVQAGGFLPTGMQLILDVNGNGVADAGEPVIAPATPLTLAAGASVRLLIGGTVPASAPNDATATLSLTVQSQDRTIVRNATATLLATGPARVVVVASATPATPSQGDTVTFSFNVAAGDPITGTAITVDAAAVDVVLLREPVPAGTAFVAATAAGGTTLLYHRRGDPPTQYFSSPGPATNVDGLAFAAATLVAGQSLGGTVTVLIAVNKSGTVTDVATLTYVDQGTERTVASNAIVLTMPVLHSTMGVYGTDAYVRTIPSFETGRSLYLQLVSQRCDGDPAVAETRRARIAALRSGDSMNVDVLETGPATGVFRSVVPLHTIAARPGGPLHQVGLISVLPDDTVTVVPEACAADAPPASALVDPAGVVFDSRSNLPIAGAGVTLIDVSGDGNGGKAGQPATVYDFDGVTIAPSTVTTSVDGSYRFPSVAPSNYRLVVVPPLGYVGPSKVAPQDLPAGRAIDARGSYGNAFVVVVDLVVLDYPLDAVPVNGLFVEKTASKRIVDIGDFVDYAVTVRNTAAGAIAAVVLHDRPPRGFSYQKGSARLNGVKVPDPLGGGSPDGALDFPLGTAAAGQQFVVGYRLRIGPGARGGDGVNRASASAGLSQSNTASAKVLLSDGGVFSDRGYLIGKVFADCNRNGVQDPGERGIPDVRIVLEDGTSAKTDEDGKYSLYGLIARTHVAKVDATTMIDGTTLEAIDSRNAGDGASRFVDMKNGELDRADFAIVGCGPSLDAAITERRARASRIAEADAASKTLLSATTLATVDVRTLPSSGTLDGKGVVARGARPGSIAGDALPSTSDISDVDQPAARSRMHASVDSGSVEARPATTPPRAALGELVPRLSAELGFIELADGAIVSSTRAAIRVKGPASGHWSLTVDGKSVGDGAIGERSVLVDRNIAAVEYVGVELAPGSNRLELIATDDFGNVRERVAITVRAAGRLASIAVDVPAEIKADGRSIVPLRIRLLDREGLPVAGRFTVTLDASAGRLLAKDLDPRETGTQVLVEDGVLDTEMLAPVDAGRGVLRVQAGAVKSDVPLIFVPDLRPLMAVGLVEGVLNLRSLGSGAIVGTSSGDAFEREIRNVSRRWDDGKASAETRAALYLKGKVLGSTLLTLAYDSDKPQRERLFRDIQPDQFYPVYGDSSVKGFDAQSTSRLYVRVDQGTSYVLYGDFTTQTDDPARSLTRYNRTLTGAQGRFEEGPVRVDGFAAYTGSRQVVDELRGNGTSGPYPLSHPNGLVDSEQVHVLTRDRNQPSIVIQDVSLTRFADYEIEPSTGRLLFKLPIPSVDADLNPISIRISYEVDDGGRNFWVGGVDAKLAVTDAASLGGVYLRDTDPTNRSTLRGVNGTVKLSDHAIVVGEFAQTDSDLYGLGKGRRVEYKQDEETFQARVYGGKTDTTFVNPNALLSQGRTEYGGKVGLRLSEQDRLSIEGIRSEDPVSSSRRTGVLARIERSFDHDVKVELGLRHVDETVALAPTTQTTPPGLAPNSFNSVRAKVSVPVPFVVGANVFGEYERAIGAGDRQVAAVGGSYALPQGGKLYLRHEFISSLTGAYDLNSTQRLTTTVIGVDADYMKDGHVFNEYRVGGGIDARSSEAAIGLRNLWRVADGIALTTTAENVKPIAGPVTDRATAVTGAVDYTTDPNWKGSARAEYRNATASDSWLVTTGAAYKWSDATTLLGKAIYSDLANASPASAGSRRIVRAQFGAAYRPVDTNVWNALARVEFKREQDSTLAGADSRATIDETAVIASAHVNVSPTHDLNFNARYGIKRATDRANGFDSHSTTQLLGGRLIKDLGDKWDVGIDAFLLASDGIRTRSDALGAEAGYRVATNLWVSVGYNVLGFREKDLAGEDYTQRGPYLRMRYKFDESVFGTSKGDRS